MTTIDTQAATTTPAERLRGLCGGAVHLPGDEAYDVARTPWNVAADLRPAAVAVPRHAGDVADVMHAALDAGLRVAPMSTGHAAAQLLLARISGRSAENSLTNPSQVGVASSDCS